MTRHSICDGWEAKLEQGMQDADLRWRTFTNMFSPFERRATAAIVSGYGEDLGCGRALKDGGRGLKQWQTT